ncbi:hypothetical protein L9F63_011306, partial [Diploptera punctata]
AISAIDKQFMVEQQWTNIGTSFVMFVLSQHFLGRSLGEILGRVSKNSISYGCILLKMYTCCVNKMASTRHRPMRACSHHIKNSESFIGSRKGCLIHIEIKCRGTKIHRLKERKLSIKFI